MNKYFVTLKYRFTERIGGKPHNVSPVVEVYAHGVECLMNNCLHFYDEKFKTTRLFAPGEWANVELDESE